MGNVFSAGKLMKCTINNSTPGCLRVFAPQNCGKSMGDEDELLTGVVPLLRRFYLSIHVLSVTFNEVNLGMATRSYLQSAPHHFIPVRQSALCLVYCYELIIF